MLQANIYELRPDQKSNYQKICLF